MIDERVKSSEECGTSHVLDHVANVGGSTNALSETEGHNCECVTCTTWMTHHNSGKTP